MDAIYLDFRKAFDTVAYRTNAYWQKARRLWCNRKMPGMDKGNTYRQFQVKMGGGVSSLFRQVYIPTGLYSDSSIFRQLDIPTGLYSDRSIFRQVVIPTGLYSDRSIFRQVYIPTSRYSDRSLFRQFLDVNCNGNYEMNHF